MCRWIVDADQIQLDDYDEKVLYRTKKVDSFLNEPKMLGIEAPKGLGKTFLLKCKRMASQNAGVICLPKNTMCDILDKVTLNESMGKYLEDYPNWIDLWKLAICISLHKEFGWEDAYNELNEEEDGLYLKIYNNLFLITPCQILNRLLNSQRSEVRKLQTRIPLYLAFIRLKIQSAVHIFIDKTDQALRDQLYYLGGATRMSRGPSNDSFWMYGQLALAEAAYSLFIQNNHVKVYFSLRSEALVGATADTELFIQLRSYIAELNYSKDEIQGIFNQYIMMEDDEWLVKPELKSSKPAEAFTGLSQMTHGYVKEDEAFRKERVFDYIYRHTLKRPRDIMHICHKLCFSTLRYDDSDDTRLRTVRHIVNKESRLLLQSYIREIGPFVFDDHLDEWDTVWPMIDTNVFSFDYAQDLCVRINEQILGHEVGCNKECEGCVHFKPFSSLFNSGLLGHTSRNNVVNDKSTIAFKSTGNVIINTNEALLPRARLYCLHPMLTNKVQAAREDRGKPFFLCKDLIVGDGYEIDEYLIHDLMHKENGRLNLKRKNSVFLSSTCFDMNDTRQLLYQELGSLDYNVIMSEANDFGVPDMDENSYDYCLDKVKTANNLIYIIGRRFGGPYRGTKYADVAKELKKLCPDIGEPSISMMEFYLAKRLNISTKVFTTKDIYNERQIFKTNGSSVEYKPTFVDTTKVFKILDFITTSTKGNWFKTYIDLRDLLEIIRIEFGKDTH